MTAWISGFQDKGSSLFDEIIDAKRRPGKSRLRRLRARVLASYGLYEQAAPDVERIQGLVLTELERDTLLDAYTGRTTPLAKMRQALFLAAGETQRCCYCQIGQLTQLDHVVPKALSPEFSTLPCNLVPCCDECNEAKSEFILDPDGIRMFIHLHGEPFRGLRWLFARFGEKRRLEFRLEFPPSVPTRARVTICSHYSKLKLFERFAERVPEVLVELKEGEWDGGVAHLRRRLVILQRTRDPNYYKIPILEAMISEFETAAQ